MMFWMGVGVLVVGVVLFGYGSLTIPSLFDRLRDLSTDPVALAEAAANLGMGTSPFQVLERQLFFVQLLQLIGLVMAVLGSVMLVYGAGRKFRASF